MNQRSNTRNNVATAMCNFSFVSEGVNAFYRRSLCVSGTGLEKWLNEEVSWSLGKAKEENLGMEVTGIDEYGIA